MTMKGRFAALLVPALIAAGCASFPDRETIRAEAEDAIAHAYPGMPSALTARASQDASQKLCSRPPQDKLTAEEAMQIVENARASIKYPASGKLVGDWKVGAQLVTNGAGLRVRDGRVEKTRENGALCINCHALDPKEVNAGNLGPSLIGYGAKRGTSDAVVKHTYEKIYNAWLYFPCSNMPRLGASGYLTPEQITHLVAYLVDPQSPVNRN
jgi:L-cysteine S-thiosulfotransferase